MARALGAESLERGDGVDICSSLVPAVLSLSTTTPRKSLAAVLNNLGLPLRSASQSRGS